MGWVMGKGYNKSIYIGLMMALAAPNAWGRETVDLAPYVSQTQSSSQQIMCSHSDYYQMTPTGEQPKPGKVIADCQSCRDKAKAAAQDVQSKYSSATASDASANANGAAASQAAAAGNNGYAEKSQKDVSGLKGKSQELLGQKTANAKLVADAGKKCSSDLKSSCNQATMAESDNSAAQKTLDACDQVSQNGDQIASEKAKSGGEMGDLSQLASALGQALGAMKPKESSPSTPTTPNSGLSSQPTTAAGLDGSKLDSALNPTGASIGALGTNGTALTDSKAGASKGTAGSSGSDPAIAASLGGSDYGTGLEMMPGGSHGAATGASSGGYGGGSGSGSSGASMMGSAKDAAAAAAANAANSDMGAYEMPMGGGGSKPFLGLKSKSVDEASLDETAPGMLADLGVEEGERGLASTDANADIHPENEGNLFVVIRSKYAEIKKRGNI